MTRPTLKAWFRAGVVQRIRKGDAELSCTLADGTSRTYGGFDGYSLKPFRLRGRG